MPGIDILHSIESVPYVRMYKMRPRKPTIEAKRNTRYRQSHTYDGCG